MILWYMHMLHYIVAHTKWTPFSADSSGKRIDDKIHIHLLLNTSAAINNNVTQGSVDIRVYTIYIIHVYVYCVGSIEPPCCMGCPSVLIKHVAYFEHCFDL